MACSLGHMTSILISPHTSEVHFGLIAEVPALILDMNVELEIVVLCGVGLSYLVICCCKSITPDCYLQSPKILWSCSKTLQQFYRRETPW